ncbi:hypothetical protein EWM64_g1680 [Hericium alpestre]|uniref:Sensitive to high expression protein 9, mitochondrial n=1 Tax=Hericium alpestre TaxID=135208 RepID=A0A4Z0A764_9AGAM|nr:hypothetical protein EWM64_g1680 [Hericium alpestre]
MRNITALKEGRDIIVDRLSTTFSRLGGEINHVTGYEEIEALKRRVVEQEALIDAARNKAREAKLAYEQAVQQRSNSQREVNELLGRKSTWADSDVSRFTALVRQDHLHEQDEARAKTAVQESEDTVERAFSDLTRSILGRYHEEQIWSDKIRSLSTYGSLAVLGVNLLVFIVAILLVEPWKRRRLVQEFEHKVEELTQTNLSVWQDSMGGLEGRLDAQQQLLIQQSTALEPVVSAVAEREAVGEVTEEPETRIEKDRYWAVRDRDMAFVMASTATAAAALGWLARSWFR